MKPRLIIAVLAFLVVTITARAQNSTRMLMYTFQDGSTSIHVGLIDTPPAPRGFVLCPTAPKRQKGFRVSRKEFEQSWHALQSGGVEKFAGPANRAFDATRNYVFSIAHMPNGAKKNYVIPKDRASRGLVSLARQFEAYAH